MKVRGSASVIRYICSLRDQSLFWYLNLVIIMEVTVHHLRWRLPVLLVVKIVDEE
jgi:hypothetical protein